MSKKLLIIGDDFQVGNLLRKELKSEFEDIIIYNYAAAVKAFALLPEFSHIIILGYNEEERARIWEEVKSRKSQEQRVICFGFEDSAGAAEDYIQYPYTDREVRKKLNINL